MGETVGMDLTFRAASSYDDDGAPRIAAPANVPAKPAKLPTLLGKPLLWRNSWSKKVVSTPVPSVALLCDDVIKVKEEGSKQRRWCQNQCRWWFCCIIIEGKEGGSRRHR